MDKVLLAINHPQTESMIKETIKQTHICVGVATYKESVIPSLKETGAEILLIREELGGSMKIPVLLKQIRIECPKVRIIIICQERDKTDPFLALLVNLGIYDIINSNAVNINTMVSYIMAPRTFRDVSQYFHMDGDIELPKEPEKKEEPKKGGGLFGFGGGKDKKPSKKATTSTTPESEQIDISAMRAVMQEEADRKARQNIDELVREATENANKDLQDALKKEKSLTDDLRTELQHKIQMEESARMELDRVRIERDDLARQLDSAKRQLRNVSVANGQQIISGTVQEHLDKIQQMERKIETLQNQLLDKDRKISELEKQLENNANLVTPVVADAKPKRSNPIFSAMKPKMNAPKKDCQVIAFLGSKHGTGNTTVSLNLAAYLAVNGYKTLYLEINSKFPLINHYFGFANVVAGVDTACKNIHKGINGIQPSIIAPRTLATTPALAKRYAKLPETLHFMTFSNEYIVSERMGMKMEPLTKAWMDLMYILGSKMGYSYIIVDLQPDDQPYINLFLKNRVADRFCMTFTQDTHSLASAAVLVKDLMNNGAQSLVQNMGFVLNKNIIKHKLNPEKIGQWLGIDGNLIQKIGMDQDGYSKAEMSAIPYVLTTGDRVLDYQDLAQNLKL